MSANSNSLPHCGAKESFDPADNFRGQTRPEHHLHRDSEPLPGNTSTNYGQIQQNDSDALDNRRDIGTPFVHPILRPFRWLIVFSGVTGVHQGTPDFQDSSFKQNAFNSERPLNVQPTDQGGVAIDGRGDLPEGKANVADKVIGKMQKVNRHQFFVP